MNPSGKVDPDDVLRARTLLLSSRGCTPAQRVAACRVLAQVSPAAYLPRLVEALHALGSYSSTAERHPDDLALCEEALAAARAVDPGLPARTEILYRALDRCQRAHYADDRRADGLALRAEMAALTRDRAESAPGRTGMGVEVWAAGLAEEGRYAEAADALTERMAATRSTGPGDPHDRLFLPWIAALNDAGRAAEALDAFAALIEAQASRASDEPHWRPVHLHSLIGHARLLDAHDHGERAAAVRREGLALLTRLTVSADRRSSTSHTASYWAALLTVTGADSERPAPGTPWPASGTDPLLWSPAAGRHYVASTAALREQIDALTPHAERAPHRHLAELARLHRVLAVRSAVQWRCRHRDSPSEELVRSLFDRGMELAARLRRLDRSLHAPLLAELLMDRAAFRLATGGVGAALDDFRDSLAAREHAYG